MSSYPSWPYQNGKGEGPIARPSSHHPRHPSDPMPSPYGRPDPYGPPQGAPSRQGYPYPPHQQSPQPPPGPSGHYPPPQSTFFGGPPYSNGQHHPHPSQSHHYASSAPPSQLHYMSSYDGPKPGHPGNHERLASATMAPLPNQGPSYSQPPPPSSAYSGPPPPHHSAPSQHSSLPPHPRYHGMPQNSQQTLPPLAAALAGHGPSFASPPPTPPPMQSLPPIQSLAAIVPSSGPSSLGLGQGPQFEQSTSASYGHARSRSLDVKDGSGKATGKRSPLANEFMPNDKESQSSSSSAPPNQAFYGSAYPNQRFGMHVNSSMQAPLPTSSPAQQPVPIAPTPVQPAERERKNSKALNKTTAPTIAKKSQREAGSTSSSRANARRRSSTSALGATPASGRRRKRSNTDSQGSSDESMKEANGEQQSNATSASKSTKTYKCETCGKVYKHPNCLLKHKWEHTEHWKEAAKFSLSKHQQVQLLEAASILVGFGLGTVGGRRPSVFEVAGIEPLKLEEVEEFNKGGEDEETREDGTRVPVEA